MLNLSVPISQFVIKITVLSIVRAQDIFHFSKTTQSRQSKSQDNINQIGGRASVKKNERKYKARHVRSL